MTKKLLMLFILYCRYLNKSDVYLLKIYSNRFKDIHISMHLDSSYFNSQLDGASNHSLNFIRDGTIVSK
jgi:hypothetical protein